MQPLPKIPPPFLQHLKKKNTDENFKKFLSVLKYLSIKISLIDVLLTMSGHAKFIMELVTKKMSLDFETINVSHSFSAIIKMEMIKKKDELGAFTILCTIGVL